MAYSVTVLGSAGTHFITTNAGTSAAFNGSLAKAISDQINLLPAGAISTDNAVWPAHVNSLSISSTTGGLNALTVAGGSAGNTFDSMTIDDWVSATVTASGTGPFKVLAGTGGLNYTGLDGPQTVIAGGGTVGGSVNFIDLSLSHGAGNFVAIGGGPGAVLTGAGADTVFAGGTGPLQILVGSGTLDFVGGANLATVIGGANTTTVIGGEGGTIEYVDKLGGAAIYHGQGGAEVFDASLSNGNNTVFGAFNQSGTETLIGGVGNDYMNPLNANASLFGGGGNDTLVGARYDSVVAGSGNATLTGGGGVDTFEFIKGYAGGQDYVTDLSGGDIVNLAYYGYSPAGITTLLASAVVSGGSSTITLSDSTKITFVGVASLNPSNFTSS